MRRSLFRFVVLTLLAACNSVDREPDIVAPDLPVDEADLYDRIGLAMSLGDPDQAIAAYRAAQLSDPDAPETRVLLANLMLAAGRIDEAGAIVTEVLQAAPENEAALFSRSLVAFARGDDVAQTAALERLLELNPEHADAHAALGELRLAAREYGAAERAFAQSLAADPQNLVALIGLGNVRLRQDKLEQAVQVFTRAIEIDANNPFAYADRSRAHSFQARLGAAESDLDRAIELDPAFAWHRYDRARVRLERNDWDGAIADFDAFLEREPDVFLAYALRGRAWGAAGDLDAAITDYERALRMRPDYLPARAPFGLLLFEDRRYRRAAEAFLTAFDDRHPADPVQPTLALWAALSLTLAGAETQAEDVLRSRIEQFPRPGPYLEIARLYLGQGSDGRVLDALRAVKTASVRAEIQFFLAGHYEAVGQNASARATYLAVGSERSARTAEARMAQLRYEALQGQP